MKNPITRRTLIASAGAAAAATVAGRAAAQQENSGKVLIVGVSCSPRKGMTTATAMAAALEAAKSVNPRIETQLIDLGGMKIASPDSPDDEFAAVLDTLKKPELGAIIIGSPTYFRSLSALCKTFIERIGVLRKPALLLAGKPVGALCVGGYRNGGQELVIDQILTAMLCHEVLVVGGKPPAHQGATLWNNYEDDIKKDELGMESAKKLGIRVAEAALR